MDPEVTCNKRGPPPPLPPPLPPFPAPTLFSSRNEDRMNGIYSLYKFPCRNLLLLLPLLPVSLSLPPPLSRGVFVDRGNRLLQRVVCPVPPGWGLPAPAPWARINTRCSSLPAISVVEGNGVSLCSRFLTKFAQTEDTTVSRTQVSGCVK